MSEIKDEIYAQVSGTVGRTFSAKNGDAFVVEIQREGSQYPDRVTVWGSDGSVSTGDRVAVKGWMSWRRNERDGKTYFDVALNKPVIVSREEVTPKQPEQDAWHTASVPVDDIESPF